MWTKVPKITLIQFITLMLSLLGFFNGHVRQNYLKDDVINLIWMTVLRFGEYIKDFIVW
jgi:hypothetical protein